MPFTTKTAFDFCGALDALVDYATGTNVVGESLGTPNSSTVNFSGTLTKTNVHRYGAAVAYGTAVSPTTANDDFSTLSATRWTINNGTQGSSAIVANELALAITAGGTADTVKLTSNFRILDDCEVYFDFNNLTGLADDADGVGIKFIVNTDNYVDCYAGIYDGAKFFGQSKFSGNLSTIIAAARTAAYGGLKLKRINTVVQFYGKDGAGAYTLIGSFPLRNSREITVEIKLYRPIDSGLSVKIDNFVVSGGKDLWANQYVAYANVDGVITGTGVTGSIAKNGTWSLTFTTAPATGTTLTMNYKEYITDPSRGDWEVRLWDNARNFSNVVTANGDETRACVLKSTGLSGVETIFIGIREWKQASTSRWGWALNVYHNDPLTLWHVNLDGFGMTTYDATYLTPSNLPMVPFSESILPLWLYVNKQRIVMVARCADSSYTGAYMGFGYRLDPPSSYPRPTLAIGERSDTYNYLYTSSRYSVHRGYGAASSGTYMLLKPTGNVYKYNTILMPPQQGDINTQAVASTYDGLLMTWPVYIKEVANNFLLVQLDGVFVARGQSLTPESTFIQGSKTYRIFKGGFDGGVYNFYAVEES